MDGIINWVVISHKTWCWGCDRCPVCCQVPEGNNLTAPIPRSGPSICTDVDQQQGTTGSSLLAGVSQALSAPAGRDCTHCIPERWAPWQHGCHWAVQCEPGPLYVLLARSCRSSRSSAAACRSSTASSQTLWVPQAAGCWSLPKRSCWHLQKGDSALVN